MAAKLLLYSTIWLLFHALACSATLYMVGDNAGWDISTNPGSWARGKNFEVGDTLLFQYSRYQPVCQVTKQNYQGCNMSNVIKSGNTGNTSFVLTSPGDKYFVSCNRLYCLGGMKLHVDVIGNRTVPPVGAPMSEARPKGAEARPGGALPPGSSKANNPSKSCILNPVRMDGLVLTLFGSLVALLGLM